MSPSQYGPIAEIRLAARSPVALLVGAIYGGAAPLINYFTIHCGHLVRFDGEQVHFRWSPLWMLVVGSFLLSSKSVFRWGVNTFGDRWSAAAMVVMLEGTLILAPHPAMGRLALAFLVALNAAAYGSVLSLRDQRDRATEKLSPAPGPAAAPAPKAAAAAAAAAPVAAVRLARPLPAVATASQSSSSSSSSSSRPEALPRALPVPAAEPVPAQNCSAGGDLYKRAVDVLWDCSWTSTSSLQQAMGVRQPTASKLMSQLEEEGAVGKPDPANRGRRPVLLRTRTKSA